MAKTDIAKMIDKAKEALARSEGGQFSELSSSPEAYDKTVDVIPCGIEAIDFGLLKHGGLPRGGHLTTIYGHPDGGKTTLLRWFMAGAQKAYPDQAVVYIDSENRVASGDDLRWLSYAGIDTSPERLILGQTRNLGWIIKAMATFSRMDCVSMIALDTITNCYTADEDAVNDGVGKTPGSVALMLSNTMPYILNQCRLHNIAIVMIAQVRTRMGEMMRGGRGPEYKPGHPKQIEHDSTIRLRVTPAGFVPSSADREAWKMRIAVERGKGYANAGRSEELLVSLSNGMPDFTTLLIETAKNMGLVLVGKGGWHSWTPPEGEELKVHGADKFKEAIEARGLTDVLRDHVQSRLKK